MEEHSKKAPTEQSAGAFGSHWSLKNLMWSLASPRDVPDYGAACPFAIPTLDYGLAAEQLRCSLGSPYDSWWDASYDAPLQFLKMPNP